MLKSLPNLAVVLVSWSSATSVAQTPVDNRVHMAIGEPGSESFVLGTELWAMGQIALKPLYGIELASIEMAKGSQRFASLEASDVEIALFDGPMTSPPSDLMRTVVTLWPEVRAADQGNPAQILAHRDVADDVIYRITRAIFENDHFFYGTKENLGETAFDLALAKTDLPIHPGASRYYEEMGISTHVTDAPLVTEVKSPTFADFDDQELSDDERAQVAAACRQAMDQGILSAVLGDLSSRGCEVYQSLLKEQANIHRLETATDVELAPLPGGQGGPAIALNGVQGRMPEKLPLSGFFPMPIKHDPRQPTM